VPIFLKSGRLNLLEPSGPVQACNGIALPFAVEHGKQMYHKYYYEQRDMTTCDNKLWVTKVTFQMQLQEA
jgi:hypothetical protein